MTRSVFNHRRASGSRYATEVLSDNPLLYWRLGEAAGSVAEDATANNRDGTYTNDGSGQIVYGGLGAIANDPNTSVRVVTGGGGNGRVRRAASTDWDNAAFSIEQWVKKESTATDTNFMHMAQVGDSNPNNWRWVLCLRGVTANEPLQVRVKGLTSSGLASANTGGLSAGVWYHVVLTWDGTDYVFYLDGSSIGTVTASASQAPQTSVTNQPFVTCSDDVDVTGGVAFEGHHDEQALYGTALSSTRIAAHYAAAL